MTVDPRLADLRRETFAALRPPPKLALSDWAERNLRLPAGVSATPGPVRLWEFQRGLADAIGDPTIPRVTCLKAVRCGYSTLLVAAVAAYASNDPCPVLMLVPTTDDARNFMVHHLEPVAGERRLQVVAHVRVVVHGEHPRRDLVLLPAVHRSSLLGS